MDVALALGGGGSRGYSHIGVIRRLEQEGYRIGAVAGTSAGAIIATLFASGYTPDDMESILGKLDQTKLFGHAHRDQPALMGFDGARKVLLTILGDKTFEQLKIPCAVVAVDIRCASEVVIKKGNLVDAVLASGAVPAVFPPQNIEGNQLIDGATLNPVPVSVARDLAPNLPIVAVTLTPTPGMEIKTAPFHLPLGLPEPILERFSKMRLAQALNIYLQATDVGSRMLTDLRLRLDAPDVIVRPEVHGIGILDPVDVHEIISRGEIAMQAALPELRKARTWTRAVGRRFRRNKQP